jgi:hypothetical protein
MGPCICACVHFVAERLGRKSYELCATLTATNSLNIGMVFSFRLWKSVAHMLEEHKGATRSSSIAPGHCTAIICFWRSIPRASFSLSTKMDFAQSTQYDTCTALANSLTHMLHRMLVRVPSIIVHNPQDLEVPRLASDHTCGRRA